MNTTFNNTNPINSNNFYDQETIVSLYQADLKSLEDLYHKDILEYFKEAKRCSLSFYKYIKANKFDILTVLIPSNQSIHEEIRALIDTYIAFKANDIDKVKQCITSVVANHINKHLENTHIFFALFDNCELQNYLYEIIELLQRDPEQQEPPVHTQPASTQEKPAPEKSAEKEEARPEEPAAPQAAAKNQLEALTSTLDELIEARPGYGTPDDMKTRFHSIESLCELVGMEYDDEKVANTIEGLQELLKKSRKLLLRFHPDKHPEHPKASSYFDFIKFLREETESKLNDLKRRSS